jgi:plasmid stabilization system protein ParE
MLEYDILPAAEEETNDAFDWYESEQEGLGASFRAEVKLTLDRILQNPTQIQIFEGTTVRRARVERFPYWIFFTETPATVLVTSIFHDSRNPIIWKGRID